MGNLKAFGRYNSLWILVCLIIGLVGSVYAHVTALVYVGLIVGIGLTVWRRQPVDNTWSDATEDDTDDPAEN